MSSLVLRRPARGRPLALLLVVLGALATLTAGCGKGQYRPPGQRPSSARAAIASAPRASRRAPAGGPVTPARARAFANAVNLTVADVPGATPAPRARHREPEDQETQRCGGAVSDAGAVQVESPNLTRGAALTREAISSRVTVLSSARLARDSVAAIERPAWLSCYERVLRRHFAGSASASGVHVQRIDVTSVPVALPGVRRTFGVRIMASLSSTRGNVTVRLYLDVFGFALGAAEINMDATSYVQPEATRTEQDLLRLMYERAGAHPL